jgi:hypothetical protein
MKFIVRIFSYMDVFFSFNLKSFYNQNKTDYGNIV